MNTEFEELKPLSFEENTDSINTESFENQRRETVEDHIPLMGSSNEIKNKDSNFVFFFGTAESGKSVILSSLLYYLKSQAGDLRPKKGTPNTFEAEGLLSDFFENIRLGILPSRTTKDQVTRLDLVFEPNNKSKKVQPINLTFLEMSGENHKDISRGGSYHSSIESYLSDNIPLTFIVVTSYDTAYKDDTLINEFFNQLERNDRNLKSINLILVISKWDKSGRMIIDSSEELDNFVRDKLSMTSMRIDTHGLSKTFYTIGDIENKNGEQRITRLSLVTAGVLSKWLYESIQGYPMDYKGTFWERLKFSFSNR